MDAYNALRRSWHGAKIRAVTKGPLFSGCDYANVCPM